MCNFNMKSTNRPNNNVTTTNSRRTSHNASTSTTSSVVVAAEERTRTDCRCSATKYEINTCPPMNCNPGIGRTPASQDDNSFAAGNDDENQQKAPPTAGDKETVGVLLVDMPQLQRFWSRLFPEAQKMDSPPNSRRRSAHSTERCDENLNGFYVVLVIVTLVCYLNGLNGDFVHDDIPAIKANNDVLALNPLPVLFKNDFWGTAMSDQNSHKSYRPLTTVSFR